jgi:hypothetical protein
MAENGWTRRRETPQRSRVARVAWFAAMYVASLALFAALVYGLRAMVPH